MESQYHTRERPASSRIGSGLCTIAAVALVATAGCGTKIDTPLPDLATKNDRPVMSSTEQKQAVEALIAKRDSTAKSQPQTPAPDPKAEKAKQQAKVQPKPQPKAEKPSETQDGSK